MPTTLEKMSKQQECLSQVKGLREHDEYHIDMDKDAIINAFFPAGMDQLAFDLSNSTSTFYGLMLQTAGSIIGQAGIDAMSQEFFRRLARVKTAQIIEIGSVLPPDTRAMVTIMIAAVFNTSPEYRFTVDHYQADYSSITLRGQDPYHRIATQVGIREFMTWPALTPFVESIRDELGLAINIGVILSRLDDNSESDCTYTFRMKS